MGKYSGYLSTDEVCKEEIKELKEILKPYHVLPGDIEEIEGMIKNPYYVLRQSYQMSNALENYIKDELGEDALKDFFSKFVTKRKEPGEHLAAYIKDLENRMLEEMERENRFKRIK